MADAAPAPQGQAAPAAAASGPIARISAILAAESAPPPQAADPDAEGLAEPTDNRQVEGAEQEESGASQEQQAEASTDESENASAEDRPAMAEIPLEQLESVELEVVVQGNKEKLTVKELREGYMKGKDYSLKTAELARQREEANEKSRQAIESERSAYIQQLTALQATLMQTVAPELQNVDWNNLAATDAFEYVRLKNRADQIANANAAIQSKIREATEKQSAEQRAMVQKRAQEARQTLEKDIPGWSDDLYKTLMTAGQEYGFKAEEIGSWLDPRSIKLLHDAYQFRQSKAKLTPPPPTKKVSIPPKALKPGNMNTNVAKQQTVDAMKRLSGSGRIADAAAVIASRLR